ncbi:hypothetical protein Mal64_31080 [Pseudobythopirellula maris]|uniref:Uncharacterized protein n=1 Tax=Pseudobythopirellula maris TaxID=2527991 RepID=A0A5C5ZK49_9BACT|nr:hypothetical protein Mal64_31080 [Pseudobythopirellula maris]
MRRATMTSDSLKLFTGARVLARVGGGFDERPWAAFALLGGRPIKEETLFN